MCKVTGCSGSKSLNCDSCGGEGENSLKGPCFRCAGTGRKEGLASSSSTKRNLQARLDECRREYASQQQIENARDFREALDYKPVIRKLLNLAEDLLRDCG